MKEEEETEHFYLATGSCDCKVRIWYWGMKNCLTMIYDLNAHRGWVRDVAWNPSSIKNYDILATCSEDHMMALWSVEINGKVAKVKKLKEFDLEGAVWRVAWSLGGAMLAVSCDTNRLENAVRVFKVNLQPF